MAGHLNKLGILKTGSIGLSTLLGIIELDDVRYRNIFIQMVPVMIIQTSLKS